MHLVAVQEKENVREKYFFGHPVTVQKSPSVRLSSSTSNYQVCNSTLHTFQYFMLLASGRKTI